VSAIAGSAATRSPPGLNGFAFQLSTVGLAGHPLQISLCIWTYGQSDPTAPTPSVPTVSITYFGASSRAAAAAEYRAIKTMTSSAGWTSLRGVGEVAATESGPSGQGFAATALSRRRSQFLKVDITTAAADPLATKHAIALLKQAARIAWPVR
jgi:hypothetical protein